MLRDYAQGAWRMRQLGQGQTLSVWLIPEVRRLVNRAAEAAGSASASRGLAVDTMAWLMLNSIRSEKVQAAKLQQLQLASVAH